MLFFGKTAAPLPMSVLILPRWQRALTRWFINRKKSRTTVLGLCPGCHEESLRAPRQYSRHLWNMVITCPRCGHISPFAEVTFGGSMSIEEGITTGTVHPSRSKDCHIACEQVGTTRTWKLPAKGGWSFLLTFACIWLAFSMFFFVAATLSSTGPELFVICLFPIIGIGLFVAGLRQLYTRHVIILDTVELVHVAEFVGKPKRKSFPRETITGVDLVVFYSQNYQPVYGIEVRAGKRRLRFGSALSMDDKRWFCADLKRALNVQEGASGLPVKAPPPVTDASRPAGALEIQELPQGCIIQVPPAPFSKWPIIGGLVFAASAAVMLFLVSDFPLANSDSSPGLFGWVWNGFSLFWMAFVALFGLMGLSVTNAGLRARRIHQRITATSEALQVIEKCGREEIETLVPATEVRDVRVSPFLVVTTRVNNRPPTKKRYHRGVIILSDHAIGFGAGCDLHELRTAVTTLNAALLRQAADEASPR